MALDRYPTSQPPLDKSPIDALRNKGTDLDKEATLRRLGWENYHTLFVPDAYMVTSWKQGTIDEFILASKEGFAKGSFDFMYILYRIIGSTVDTNSSSTRAVCKIKAIITCRFTFDGVEMDNEADCRFFFLLEKQGPRWGVCFFSLLFEVPEEEAEGLPDGYRYLAWAEGKVGVAPKSNLDSYGPERDVLYRKCGGIGWREML